jgi:hypothetical protein
MSKEDLVFPGEPVVRVKDPSALESPEVTRSHIKGAKHDLVFPEGKEAREAKSIQGSEAQEPYAGCVAPSRGLVFRALTAVAAVALVGLGFAAVRPLDGRLRPVLAVGVVACGARFAR